MRVEIVAVGTELLLGQIVDTNSAWLAERLAAAGVECHFQTRVGDNPARLAGVVRAALARNDAAVVCGGLGPTQDDVTREALAAVMNVPLVRDAALVAAISERFALYGRSMPASNLRQAEVPDGATPIAQTTGTAPGLICPVGNKVVYAVPGVPREMTEMVERAVVPDLVARGGSGTAIVSRTLRTWGASESRIAELLAGHVAELDEAGSPATVAFLASGVEGIKVRITVRAPGTDAASAILDEQETRLRSVLGDLVFGVDAEGIEDAVGRLLERAGLTLAAAESLTGGMVAARIVDVPGASAWFRGGLVAYDPAVKFSVLDVPPGDVVTESAARSMAEGVRRLVRADIGLAVTGVAGPASTEGKPPGTVVVGFAGPGAAAEAVTVHLPGDRRTVRELATITALDLVRRRLASGAGRR